LAIRYAVADITRAAAAAAADSCLDLAACHKNYRAGVKFKGAMAAVVRQRHLLVNRWVFIIKLTVINTHMLAGYVPLGLICKFNYSVFSQYDYYYDTVN
jgi:hypothetical protein